MTLGQAMLFEVVAIVRTARCSPSVSLRKASSTLPSKSSSAVCASFHAVAPQSWRGLDALFVQRRVRLDIGLFSEELAALLDAGLGIVHGSARWATKERDVAARQAIERIAVDLSQGLPFSKALANQSDTFPPLLIEPLPAASE